MKNKREGHYGGRYCRSKRRISCVCTTRAQSAGLPAVTCASGFFLEHYFSFWSECIPAHVRHPWSASVISAISRPSPCQGHLARSSGWRLPVSRTRWSPLHTLRCAGYRSEGETSRATLGSQALKLSAADLEYWSGHDTQMKRKDVSPGCRECPTMPDWFPMKWTSGCIFGIRRALSSQAGRSLILLSLCVLVLLEIYCNESKLCHNRVSCFTHLALFQSQHPHPHPPQNLAAFGLFCSILLNLHMAKNE